MITHEEIKSSISNTRRIFEIAAVLSTGIGKFIFMDLLNWKLLFILVAISAWTVYIAFRYYQNKGILRYWGFRSDNLRSVTSRVLPFGILAIIAFFIIGFLQDTINLSWHLLPILIIYPIWGAIQQFLLIGLVTGNCQDLTSFSIPTSIILLLSALLFSAVHYPHYWLMLVTFILAFFYGYLYLKDRNIYVLGLFHGWLGGLFFYTVVDRDPFLEVFGKLLQ